MYLERFRLTRMPFEISPDPTLFFASATHRLALSMLEYAIVSGADLCLVTGEVGSGKTTLVHCLLGRGRRNDRIGVVSNTHRAFGDLLDLILGAFEIEAGDASAATKYKRFAAFVDAARAEGARVVLLIDEAQNLSVEDLEAIRILTNVNGPGRKALQVVLVGQPELRATLKRKELRQLVQRIPVDFDLKPLTRKDISCYIAHRLAACGRRETLFTPEAIDAVADHSKGIPRVVNLICDLALVFAYAEDADAVSEAIVREVVREKSADGLFWHTSQNGASSEPG